MIPSVIGPMVLAGAALLSSGASTKSISTWAAPDLSPSPFKGQKVAAVVLTQAPESRRGSEDYLAWELRKREQVARVKVMPEDAVLVKAADVLHNVQSLLADIQRTDDLASVWRPFNAGPRRQLWYFESVSEAVGRRLGDHPLSRELRAAVSCLRTALPG